MHESIELGHQSAALREPNFGDLLGGSKRPRKPIEARRRLKQERDPAPRLSRMRLADLLAVGVAALGVAWLTWQAGAVPWIGLVLALTFGLYGLLRKTAVLGAVEGLTLETVLLTPLAAVYLLWLAHTGKSGFADGDTVTRLLLAAAGPVTAVPLLLFAAGARRIRFSTLGLLQYLAPSLQLVLGVWLYHEPFAARAPGYALIWLALAVFSLEGVVQGWRRRAAA